MNSSISVIHEVQNNIVHMAENKENMDCNSLDFPVRSVTSGNVFPSDICVQTDVCLERDERRMYAALHRSKKMLKKFKARAEKMQNKVVAIRGTVRLTVSSLKTNCVKCKYFTGIHSGRVLMYLYSALEEDIPSFSRLTKEEVFVLTLRKL